MTLTSAQLGAKGEASPTLFEHRKNFPDSWRKDPDCVHHWAKFFIQNVVLGVSTRKNSKMFPYRASFSRAFDEIFIQMRNLHKPLPLAQNNLWLCTCIQILFFLQSAPS